MLRAWRIAVAAALCAPAPALAAGIDLHLHLPMIEDRARVKDLEAADVRLIVAVAYAPPVLSQLRGGYAREVLRQFGRIERWAAKDPRVKVVRTPDEAEAILKSKEWGLGVILAAEGAGGADTPERLERLWERGLRVLTIAHFTDSAWGGAAAVRYWPRATCVPGGKPDERRNPKGLTPEGERLVAWAAAKGLLLDLTHSSDKTAMDLARLRPDMPLLFTHEAARELTPCERTIPPELLREVARSGGLVGLTLSANYAGPDLEALKKHAALLRRDAGDARVVIGSDFNGVIRPIPGAAGPENYREALKALRPGGAEAFVDFWRRSLRTAGPAGTAR